MVGRGPRTERGRVQLKGRSGMESAMAVNSDPGNNHSGNNNPGDANASEQNPVRLTLGHYYCANCGEDGLSRSDARCPRCQDYLRWERVAM